MVYCIIIHTIRYVDVIVIDKIRYHSENTDYTFRLVTSIFGYGFVLSQFTVLCLESIFQKRETCLLLKNSLDLLYQNMEHPVYTDGGTWYDEACNVIGLKHICIPQ